MAFQKIWGFFQNLWTEFKFDSNLTRIMCTLHEDILTFMILLAKFFLEWEIFQTKGAEIIKTHISCSIFLSPKIVFFMSYLLTPWCRVLEQLTGLQLVKKFPAFHGTPRFITALTSVCHLSLSWASPIQSIYPHPTSWISILILSTHLCLGLPSGLLPSSFPTKTLYTPSPHPYLPHSQPISFLSILSPA